MEGYKTEVGGKGKARKGIRKDEKVGVGLGKLKKRKGMDEYGIEKDRKGREGRGKCGRMQI